MLYEVITQQAVDGAYAHAHGARKDEGGHRVENEHCAGIAGGAEQVEDAEEHQARLDGDALYEPDGIVQTGVAPHALVQPHAQKHGKLDAEDEWQQLEVLEHVVVRDVEIKPVV